MGTSIVDLQRTLFLATIRETTGNDWKNLVVDRASRHLLFNVTKEDDVLNANIIQVQDIESRREVQPDTDAIYLVSPLPHVVECLKGDLARKRYRRTFLIWTSALPRQLGEALFGSESRRAMIADSRSLNIDFFPQESNLVSFREPWSFHVLFNPSCNAVIRPHLDSLTQKIVSVCVSLGEYPLVKYYKPMNPNYDAAVLCQHLASFVQNALDDYARNPRNNFPPQSPRPRATLIITDRSMDLMAPLVHELTYQAMAMDLLPMEESQSTGKLTYRNVIRRGQPDQEEKVVEIGENDNIWVENRHLHMKDLLIKLSNDFKKFQAKNPQFADTDGAPVSVNTIKDMLAGLPQFQEGKDAFSLHIDMAEKCAKIFQECKLMDLTSAEQSLATGLDEDNRKPKNLTDQLVRLLDDDLVSADDRRRLLLMYILYRNGILAGDTTKLAEHGQIPEMKSMVYNLEELGAKLHKTLEEVRTPVAPPPPLFAPRITQYAPGEEVSLSRFEPNLRYLLEETCKDNMRNVPFMKPVKPHLDNPEPQSAGPQTSLRSAAAPTWAKGRGASTKPKQRIIVFIAGGATYSESRACYEISQQMQKEIYLSTTHMITPKRFLRQVSMLRAPRRDLRLPADEEPPRLPAWLSESQPDPRPAGLPGAPVPNGRAPQILINPMHTMSLGTDDGRSQNTAMRALSPARPSPAGQPGTPDSPAEGKLKKEKKEKKFGIFKKL